MCFLFKQQNTTAVSSRIANAIAITGETTIVTTSTTDRSDVAVHSNKDVQ